jgi:hypothetical protein
MASGGAEKAVGEARCVASMSPGRSVASPSPVAIASSLTDGPWQALAVAGVMASGGA